MKFHIVQVNEKIQDISRKYNVSVDEIQKMNRHINNIDYIVPGMKIRLPILTEPVDDEIKDDFVDIEKYYPKIEDFKEVQTNLKKTEEEPEEIGIAPQHETEKAEAYPKHSYGKQPNYQYNPYAQYQPHPQQYYPYPQQPNPYYPYPQQYPYYQQINPYQGRENNQQYPHYQQVNPYQGQETKQQQIYNVPNQPQMQNTLPQELTVEQYKVENNRQETSLYNQPALCDPILFENSPQKRGENERKQTGFYQDPLFKPPYPTKVTERNHHNDEEGYDEEVKEIKVDLRNFVRRHTKVNKKIKKDPLDLL